MHMASITEGIESCFWNIYTCARNDKQIHQWGGKSTTGQEELYSEHVKNIFQELTTLQKFKEVPWADGGAAREIHLTEIPHVILILFPGKSGPRKRDTSFFFTVADIYGETSIWALCQSQ